VSLTAGIVSQREQHGIPHAVSCRALGVSQAWFYKWRSGALPPRAERRAALAAEPMWWMPPKSGDRVRWCQRQDAGQGVPGDVRRRCGPSPAGRSTAWRTGPDLPAEPGN
jgi:hypothetical protein